MSEKREFIVLDSAKVFIIDSDRDKLLFEGDFITPPLGYHSIIEKGKGIKKYNQNSYRFLYNLIETDVNILDVPFLFMIYESHNNYYVLEYFNQKEDNFFLKSITHNILPDDLNVNFYDNPQRKYYVNKQIDYNKLIYYLNQVDKIEVTLEYLYKQHNFYKNFRVVFQYDKPFCGSYIESKGDKDIKNFIILGMDLTRIIKQVISDSIENNYLNPPQLIQSQYKNFNIYRFESFHDPIWNFFYYFDDNTNEYVIREKIYPHENTSILIYSKEYNFLTSYLNETYNPPVRNIDHEIRVPKNIFETQISYIDRIEMTLRFSYVYSNIPVIITKTYYLDEEMYVEIIKPEGEKVFYGYVGKDLNYNPFIIYKRAFDGKYVSGGIQNSSYNPPTFIQITYNLFGARCYEFQIPSRG